MTKEIKITKKTIWVTLAIIILFAGIFLSLNNNPTANSVKNNPASSQTEEGIAEGKLAKDFSLVSIDGNVVKLSDFRGKYVLFASMATWCTPCQIEGQNVKRAQDNFEHLPLVVMQIDVDQKEKKQDLIRFREDFGKEDWIMGFDDGSIVQLYNIRSFDTTLIVDPDGKIIYRDNGFPIDTKTLEDLIIKGESSSLVLGSTHEHADISVTLGNEEIDFSQPKYQLRSSFVHFEGGDGKEVHVHAKGVTLKYLFETLRWEIDNDCIVADVGRYCDGEIIVDGQKTGIDHEIKDEETIEVIYK